MVTVIEKAMVQGEVSKLVANKKMFTAWDLTKRLQKADPDVKHYIIREAVNEIFNCGDMGDYVRDTLTIPGATNGLRPWVYHLPEVDVSEYLKQDNSDKVKLSPVSAVNSKTIKLAPAVMSVKNIPTTLPIQKNRIRVNIGSKLLKCIGCAPHDKVIVSTSTDCVRTLSLRKYIGKPVDASTLTTYRVTSDNRIVLTQYILDNILSPRKTSVSVEVKKDEILVY
jgi:hypothetical protein